MATIRELISEIRNSLRAVSIDEWIPAKYIYFKLKGFASLFIKREADDRRLFRYTDIWTTIKCLEMVEDDLINCCDISIPNCTKVMKSKHKLPEIYTARYGYLINVTSLDYGKDYTPTTPQQYKYTKARKFVDRSKRYFWIENGHLIIPDSLVKSVTIKAMFVSKAEALRINCDAEESCIPFLDEAFVAPDHLLQDIKSATTADIINTYKRLQPDEMPNLNSFEKTNQQSI